MSDLVIVTFKMKEDDLERLDSVARVLGKTRSEVVREAIEMLLRLEKYRFEPQYKLVRLLG